MTRSEAAPDCRTEARPRRLEEESDEVARRLFLGMPSETGQRG